MRRRASTISSVRHGRRNSTVKSVALSVPLLENDSKLEDLIDLLSSSSASSSANGKVVDLNNYPFNSDETLYLWRHFLDQFEVDSLISFEDDEQLNDLISNEKIYEYKNQIHHILEQHQSFIEETDSLQVILQQMLNKSEQVSLQTDEFQSKSNQLIDQIDTYTNLSRDLNENLQIFQQLDGFVSYLNTNNLNIFDERFKLNLSRLDECLEFVFKEENSDFKEIEIYQIKFKQCMVRALTLIRNQVVNGFKDISNELHGSHLSSVTLDALIYNKFENDSAKFKNLLGEIYKRAGRDKEYLGLLNDCYNTYFKIRKPFLSNMIHSHITNYNGSNKVLVHYAQDQIQFFSNLCVEEFKLFKLIFYEVEGDNELNYIKIHKWLEELLNPCFQLCENKILRETNIDRLCELIILFQKYYEYDEDQNDAETMKNYDDVSFDKLFEPIVNDIQQKLVIRINVYIDRNIINYKPTGNELTIGHRRKRQPQPSPDDDSNDTSSIVSASMGSTMGSIIDDEDGSYEELLQNYYPPIVKSIKLLNKIYLLVNNQVFSNLANSIIHLLILSIKENFEKNNIKNYSNLNDLKLYLIKNFIYLTRTIETNFDIEYVGNETNLDFSGLQNLIFGVINKKESTMNTKQQTSFFQRIIDSVPRYVSNVIDGKYELQLELRNIIQVYIDECASTILSPILEIDESVPKDQIIEKMDLFKSSLHQELNKYQSQIELFINDDLDIVYSLVNGIKENIILKYDEFHDKLNDKVDPELLMDSDTLFFYLNK